MHRAYCEDKTTVTFKIHNIHNEDPYCMRPYPKGSNFPSYTAKSGSCVRVTQKDYGKYLINPRDFSNNTKSRQQREDEKG